MLLGDARAKIKRANEHIAELKRRVGSLPDCYVATVEINPDTGNEVVKYTLRDDKIVDDIALILGDAVHNLKCALDYTWIETIRRLAPSAVGKFAKFPVYQTEDQLKIALHGGEINRSAPKLFDFMVSNIQPYYRGNYAIWPVHKLDIRDKHRLLIPVVHVASITGLEVEDERGEIDKGFTGSTTQIPPYFVPIPLGWHVKQKGKVAVEVIFEDSMSGYKMDIPESIFLYSGFIFKIVELLEQFVETA